MTQASILTVSSYPTRTSPVLRGKWVLQNLLGAPPPDPPAGVPPLDVAAVGTTVSLRAQLEEHRANVTCAVCHDQIDPIGFGLERYDATGAWRTHDGPFEIDDSGTLPDGTTFRGALELKGILRSQHGAFTKNLTEKLLTYALGRGLEAPRWRCHFSMPWCRRSLEPRRCTLPRRHGWRSSMCRTASSWTSGPSPGSTARFRCQPSSPEFSSQLRRIGTSSPSLSGLMQDGGRAHGDGPGDHARAGAS